MSNPKHFKLMEKAEAKPLNEEEVIKRIFEDQPNEVQPRNYSVFCFLVGEIQKVRAAAFFAASQTSNENFKQRLFEYSDRLVGEEKKEAKKFLKDLAPQIFDKC